MLALSVKQPWAALLAHGVKTVEVRTWPTPRRGPVLIHASKTPDSRPEAWAWITTPTLEESAAILGGVIGKAELADCIQYPTAVRFEADRGRHLNAPEWFVEGGLYGFVFRAAHPIAYHACRGSTFFFPVEGIE